MVAHMPTGAGKTRVACHTACSLLNRANSESKIVIWLASTEELCAQAADDLALGVGALGQSPREGKPVLGKLVRRPLQPRKRVSGCRSAQAVGRFGAEMYG